jgi:hypothetical protein
MAEALMLSPNGGAVAVWASSGLTAPEPQFSMDRTLAQTLFAAPRVVLGDAIMSAKASITDLDAKRTFILFGDPAMRLQAPQQGAPATATPTPKPISNLPVAIRRSEPAVRKGTKPGLE